MSVKAHFPEPLRTGETSNTSNAHACGSHLDYGDYTGLSFFAGIVAPVWADNSNSTDDNPDGALHELDIYTAAVRAPG